MSGDAMDCAAVGAHLARHGITLLPGERPRFSGGFANRNYRIELAGGPAVLRPPPPGPLPPGALGFVPRNLHLCEDESVIGVSFQILDPATLRPSAVVDWGQGTRGDPPAMEHLQQMPTAAPGFLTREQAALRWAELTGRDVSDIRFHRVLGIVKLVVIFLQLHALFRRGAVTDARFAGFDALGQGLLVFGRDVASGRVF